MAIAITIGSSHILAARPRHMADDCTCETAKKRCMPPYVFSISGQVRFRSALEHASGCESRHCARLKKKILRGMRKKLAWLVSEEMILGCKAVRPLLYATNKVKLTIDDFDLAARHLSRCPDESCAQLRRAVLLTVRDTVRT